jgi:hypothetical protein
MEYGSAKTMDSLRSLASPNAHVVRNGKILSIPSPEVVVGDIVEVKTGDTLPADLRLIETVNFETDEALLTGESLPVAKDCDASWDEEAKGGGFDPRDIGVGDRISMAYSSSTVTKGRAKGVVVAIGMQTSIGSIAESLRGGDSKVRKVRTFSFLLFPFSFRDLTLLLPLGPPKRRRSCSVAPLPQGVGAHDGRHHRPVSRSHGRNASSTHSLLARHWPYVLFRSPCPSFRRY